MSPLWRHSLFSLVNIHGTYCKPCRLSTERFRKKKECFSEKQHGCPLSASNLFNSSAHRIKYSKLSTKTEAKVDYSGFITYISVCILAHKYNDFLVYVNIVTWIFTWQSSKWLDLWFKEKLLWICTTVNFKFNLNQSFLDELVEDETQKCVAGC